MRHPPPHLAKKVAQKTRQSRSKRHGAGLLKKVVVLMEEPIPLSQQFSDALEEATKEFLELLLRIGLAKEEQDAE